MEVRVPLNIVLGWIGEAYTPGYDTYQIDFCGTILHIQLYEDGGYASVISTRNFSIDDLNESSYCMEVIGVY